MHGSAWLGIATALRQGVPFECLFTQIWHELFGLATRQLVRSGILFDPAGRLVRYKGSYPTIWRRALYNFNVRRRSPRPGDRWHLDEVFLKINGRLHYLWRAVDQDGDVLDILVQRHKDKKAAKKFFRKLLKGLQYVPNVIITDK